MARCTPPRDLARPLRGHRQAQGVRSIYRVLWRHWGPQGWWPAETPFEVTVGAILTQHTAWRHVERAIARLKRAGVLSAARLGRVPRRTLAQYLRPVGLFRVKTQRLRTYVSWLNAVWHGNLARAFAQPTATVRHALLQLNGIGPETADAMLLYAGQHAIFVVDAYTQRVFQRHGLVIRGATYDTVQRLVHQVLPARAQRLNEYHALLVRVGTRYCRTVPRCEQCPLLLLPRVRGVWPTSKPQTKPHRPRVRVAKSA